MRFRVTVVSKVAVIVGLLSASASHVRGENRPIDAERSTLTVLVYKSGLFSAFADNHVIGAPIAAGSISEDSPLGIDVTVRSADLRVLDPGLSAERRAEVQTRMLGREVLDVAKFPEITFASTIIEPAGADRWQVTGRLTIHGQSRPITFSVVRGNTAYRGEFAIKQREFGIEPITVAGGTVKVKDELRVQFEIAR
jgi:YceI-like protein